MSFESTQSELIPDNSQLLRPTSPGLDSKSNADSRSKSPHRFHTDPEGDRSSSDVRLKSFKRLIICCDG